MTRKFTDKKLLVATHNQGKLDEMRALLAPFGVPVIGAADMDLPLLPSTSAIQPLLVGSASKAMELSAALRQAGILVAAIRPPTVAPGQSRLRITFSAAHNEQQLDRLLSVLADSLP